MNAFWHICLVWLTTDRKFHIDDWDEIVVVVVLVDKDASFPHDEGYVVEVGVFGDKQELGDIEDCEESSEIGVTGVRVDELEDKVDVDSEIVNPLEHLQVVLNEQRHVIRDCVDSKDDEVEEVGKEGARINIVTPEVEVVEGTRFIEIGEGVLLVEESEWKNWGSSNGMEVGVETGLIVGNIEANFLRVHKL